MRNRLVVCGGVPCTWVPAIAYQGWCASSSGTLLIPTETFTQLKTLAGLKLSSRSWSTGDPRTCHQCLYGTAELYPRQLSFLVACLSLQMTRTLLADRCDTERERGSPYSTRQHGLWDLNAASERRPTVGADDSNRLLLYLMLTRISGRSSCHKPVCTDHNQQDPLKSTTSKHVKLSKRTFHDNRDRCC